MGFEGTSCLDEAWGRILPAEGTVLQTARSTLHALFSWADQPLWRVAGEGQVQTLRRLEQYSAERTRGTLLAGLQGLVSAGLERVSRLNMGFPGGTPGKDLACQQVSCKRHRFHPWVRKIPWRRHGSPLQYSCLENPMDRGAWQATVHGITQNQIRLKQLSTAHMHYKTTDDSAFQKTS